MSSEHHKWEPEEDVQDTCRRVVEIIIADENPEVDNLKEVDIPEHIQEKLEKQRAAEAASAVCLFFLHALLICSRHRRVRPACQQLKTSKVLAA